MSASARLHALSPELLAFRDFRREPAGVWLWPGGPEPFVRVSGRAYRILAGADLSLASFGAARIETLRQRGILLESEALDEYTERVATALGLLGEQCLPEAAIEFRRARLATPVLTTTWLAEAFTLLRTGGRSGSRALLEQYLARWPGDPAASALLAATDQPSRIANQRGHVMVLAPSAALAQELAARANDCVGRIRALCGYPPNPTLVVLVTDSAETGGRCLRGGSPFARLIELTAGAVEHSTLLAHELIHATLSSSNLAFAEGLALHVSARLSSPCREAWPIALQWLADEGDVDLELEGLFLDVDTQAGAFEGTRQELAHAPGKMPRAHWLAFLGTTALVAHVGLVALVDYLRWLRDPTPAAALATQEQLFELHFGRSLRAALRSRGASEFTS